MEKKTPLTKEQKKIIKLIMDGKVYAQVQHVSRSGMSRKIAFYYVNKDKRIINISEDIHGLNWYWKYEYPCITVGGCWMDMIFATLYYSLPYKQRSKRNQRYTMLSTC